MNEETLMQVQAYLDNELTPADARKVAEVISTDPEARAIYQELKDTREILTTTGEAPLQLQDTREFYWSQIQRRIAAAEPRPATAPIGSWWLRLVAPLGLLVRRLVGRPTGGVRSTWYRRTPMVRLSCPPA